MPPQIDKIIVNTEQSWKWQREAQLPRLPSESKLYTNYAKSYFFVNLLSERDIVIERESMLKPR